VSLVDVPSLKVLKSVPVGDAPWGLQFRSTKGNLRSSQNPDRSQMISQIAAVLLIVVVGMCVVAFPFVLWMLFGDNGPRFRPMRHIARPRENDTTDLYFWSEDRKKAPPGYDGA
jgi:hypothetical protein